MKKTNSPIFYSPDGTFRMILNLKKINECVEAPHFKMVSVKNVLCMIEPGPWMLSVDLKDAFFTIPIHYDYQKFFKFIHKRISYEFNSIANEYSDAMRVFIKIFKASFLILKRNKISISYICRRFLSARQKTRRVFTKHYGNRQVVTISWVYYPPRKICAKTHAKINVFRICPESKNLTLSLTDAKKENIK